MIIAALGAVAAVTLWTLIEDRNKWAALDKTKKELE